MRFRDNKEFAPGEFYHIYNRGNGKMNIFRDVEDFIFFLSRLEENLFPDKEAIDRHKQKFPDSYIRGTLPEKSFTIICYCLMPNHYHILIRQNADTSVSKLVAKLATGFSMYFNKKYKNVGSVFQGKFKAVRVDSDNYLSWLSAYIHQNPAVAGIVKNIIDYRYSSYLDYIGISNSKICDTSLLLGMFEDKIKDYKEFVDSSFELIKSKKEMKDLLLDD